MLNSYILDKDGNPVKANSIEEFGKWFGTANRRVAYDVIGDVEISTVFLAIDYNWTSQGAPILWETMIFGGRYDQYQQRYTSQEAAVKGHEKAVELVMDEMNDRSITKQEDSPDDNS